MKMRRKRKEGRERKDRVNGRIEVERLSDREKDKRQREIESK